MSAPAPLGRWRAVRLLLAAFAVAGLVGCATPRPADYAAERPRLELRDYFDGALDAHGVVTDRAGRVLQRFTVQLDGRWSGDEGVLEEDFRYSDGRTERRTWRLRRLGDGRYTGRAADVVGEADGEGAGNALQWRYTLRVPLADGRTIDVDLEDWMFLVDERVLLNRATMRKFGIRVGEVLIAFRRR